MDLWRRWSADVRVERISIGLIFSALIHATTRIKYSSTSWASFTHGPSHRDKDSAVRVRAPSGFYKTDCRGVRRSWDLRKNRRNPWDIVSLVLVRMYYHDDKQLNNL